MVILLHILGNGGVLNSAVIFSGNYDAAWLIEIAAFCAVNCFAIASGYVGVNARCGYSNIIHLWLNVFYYNVLIFVVFALVGIIDTLPESIIKLAFPVADSQYWYFSAYFAMFFFVPVLNIGINGIKKSELLITIVVVGILFSVLPLYFGGSYYGLNSGYSTLWLIYLYIVGGYLKKHVVIDSAKAKLLLLMVSIACILIAFSGHLALVKYHVFVNESFMGKILSGLVRYTSPTVLITAIALVLLFAHLRVEGTLSRKLIKILAPAAFSVYLIHAAPLIWILMKDKFVYMVQMSTIEMVLYILGTALIIYFSCTAIDYVRILFFRTLKIKDKLKAIDKRIG